MWAITRGVGATLHSRRSFLNRPCATVEVDAQTPLNAIPDFVARALWDHELLDAFISRPLHQRNDYLSWINRAKRDETKQRRQAQILDDLKAGDRYMKMAWRLRSR